MNKPVYPARVLRRLSFRVLATASLLFLSSPGYPDDMPPSHATAGLRMGDSTVEGFGDLLIPLARRGDSLFFINPRFSIKDEGDTEANVGVVWRKLLPGGNVIVGANAYIDSRESKHGNRFNQFGAGLEVMGKWLDARVNWYDADNDPELVRETRTIETNTSRRVATSREVSTATRISESTGVSGPYATGHRIVKDIETTRDSTIATTTRLTTTTRIATTTTERLFREFEAGLDGYDAEIGVRLPLPEGAPEVRVFAGRYDFEGEFGRELKGDKARLEVRAGPYLTFDAEWFEDAELNGTDYFIGARLHVPLYADGTTWKRFREGFSGAKRPFAERKYTDMVMRDVRVQMEESGPIEDTARRRQKTEVETRTITQASTQTETESEKFVVDTVVLRDGITFVDGDNDGGPIEDGTFENPQGTLAEGVGSADTTGNNTIFLCGSGDGGKCDLSGGAGAYDERVTLMANQTLTSSIEIGGGETFQTASLPIIAPTTGANGDAVIAASGNNVIHRIHVDGTGAPEVDGVRVDAPDVTITKNVVTTRGGADSGTDLLLNGVGINVVSSGAGAVIIEGNQVETDDAFAPGIVIDNGGDFTARIMGNRITTRAGASPAIFASGDGGGAILIQGNVAMTDSVSGAGAYDPHTTQRIGGIMAAQYGSGSLDIVENTVTGLESAASISTFTGPGASSVVTIARNTVESPFGGGIFTEHQGGGATLIDGNKSTVGLGYGVETHNSGTGDTTISNNTVPGGLGGVYTHNEGSGDTSIVGNTLTVEGDAIFARSGHPSLPTKTTITDNTATSNQGNAVAVWRQGNECLVISGNSIDGGPDTDDYEVLFRFDVEVQGYADLLANNTFPDQARIGTFNGSPVNVVSCP